MNKTTLSRALWISDYFPRPHDLTTGTWALECVVALQSAGLPVVVMAPTPWIPRPMALTQVLRDWSRVPGEHEIRGVPIYYPRCPHYPKRWINNVLYNKLPILDTALLWPWCRRAAERMMERHPFDVVHANFLFPSGYLGLKLKQLYGTPLIVHERSVQRLAMARAQASRRRLYRRILREADVVVTENENMAAELRDMEPAIADVRVFRQPGSHPELVGSLTQERPPAFAGKHVILSVGTLAERKGHEYLVRAVGKIRSEFPELVCRIIGAGPKLEQLQELVDRLGLSEIVELRGKRPHAEVLGEMSWCDIFALPSWGEASGTVYGEAMQFGKPVIACTGEGITDVVQDEKHGRLVAPRDVSALADALRWLLIDNSRRERIAEQARELASAELSYPKLASALIHLYGKLLPPENKERTTNAALPRSDSNLAS